MTRKWCFTALAGLVVVSTVLAQGAETGRTVVDLSGPGWKLWRDKDSQWKTEPHVYLRHDASGLFKQDDDPAIYNPDTPGTLTIGQLPVNPPTGGWETLDKQCEAEVAVPGTVDEYLWGKDGDPIDNNGKYFGVSWWWREFSVPGDLKGKRVILQVGATRQRSEIYVDGKLCAYDVVGNTPYEFDITPFVKAGAKHRIAFRITNPGGSFNWGDNGVLDLGAVKVSSSHGFSGISGSVSIRIVEPVSIADLWMRNTPAMRDIIPTVTVDNTSGKAIQRDLEVVIKDVASGTVVATVKKPVALAAGLSETAIPITVAEAKLWTPETPNLYSCSVALTEKGAVEDVVEKSFGFRWFDVHGIGTNSVLRLNGKRVRMISAISWGFWPQSGLIATPELAAKQVAVAKRIGLNMLNHHRCIGDPKTFDEADKQGLMYYCEVGGFEGMHAKEFAFAQNREKYLRMVKRDRSHPSVVHYNMANEAAGMRHEGQKRDMRDAHALDPTRTITWSSGGVMANKGREPRKLWMKPLDTNQYDYGWQDVHHSSVMDAYIDALYRGPNEYHCRGADNRGEIVIWGEESAIGTPPRLQLLHDLCSKPGHRKGWDGDEWILRYNHLKDWLEQSGMHRWYTVDSLTQAVGEKEYYYQGRVLENVLIDDSSDGDIINGWENDKDSSMSGLVDLWRNPKTEKVDLIKAYARPLYVAVKLREKIAHVGGKVIADFWIVNEKDVKGEAELRVDLVSPSKKTVSLEPKTVKVSGGDCYGELLQEAVPITALDEAGYYTVRATLVQGGKTIADGNDQIFVVDWKSMTLPARGAVLETDGRVAKFLKKQKGLEVPAYADSLGKLDYVLVGWSLDPAPATILGGPAVTLPDGSGPGLKAEYFLEESRKTRVLTRTEPALDFGGTNSLPDPRLKPGSFSVLWTGKLEVPEEGDYEFSISRKDTCGVMVDNQSILSRSGNQSQVVRLKAGKLPVRVTCSGIAAQGKVKLSWRPVKMASVTHLDSLVRRAREDGTTVVFLQPILAGSYFARYGDELMLQLVKKGVIPRYEGVLTCGACWLGGSYFAGAGPMFDGLPERKAFCWEYQMLAQNPGNMRWMRIKGDKVGDGQMNIALRIPGVEALVGAVTDFNFDKDMKKPGTAVGVVPCGKGKIILSTLPILPYLEVDCGATHVVRKLLLNMVQL
jgi:hypothetical protein